jgi:hypothetical protein
MFLELWLLRYRAKGRNEQNVEGVILNLIRVFFFSPGIPKLVIKRFPISNLYYWSSNFIIILHLKAINKKNTQEKSDRNLIFRNKKYPNLNFSKLFNIRSSFYFIYYS